jgi:S-adenosylmethionine:tRNA ribosyltransferase-isomerase
MVNASKPVRAGALLRIERAPDVEIHVASVEGDGFVVLDLPMDAHRLARRWGEVPLPPYLGRNAEAEDRDRYQTVYARPDAEGSVAAPTAGLHFTPRVLGALRARRIESVSITLHVGPGTFLPVRTEKIEEHRMLPERYEMSAGAAEAIERTRARGGRVVAVGTTVTRVLDSIGRPARAGAGATSWFITPGHVFSSLDVLITNFHLPHSTLLMLVSAFAGHERILSAYREAVDKGYRFFSYGDAMLIL